MSGGTDARPFLLTYHFFENNWKFPLKIAVFGPFLAKRLPFDGTVALFDNTNTNTAFSGLKNPENSMSGGTDAHPFLLTYHFFENNWKFPLKITVFSPFLAKRLPFDGTVALFDTTKMNTAFCRLKNPENSTSRGTDAHPFLLMYHFFENNWKFPLIIAILGPFWSKCLLSTVRPLFSTIPFRIRLHATIRYSVQYSTVLYYAHVQYAQYNTVPIQYVQYSTGLYFVHLTKAVLYCTVVP